MIPLSLDDSDWLLGDSCSNWSNNVEVSMDAGVGVDYLIASHSLRISS